MSKRLTAAAFKSPMVGDIRAEIWLRLRGNLGLHPISAPTHATPVAIGRFPDTRAPARSMMERAQAIANRLGIAFRVDVDRRIGGAEKVGTHKTSMLRDVEAGRGIDLEAPVGSVIELGRLTGAPSRHIDTVYALFGSWRKAWTRRTRGW